VLFLTVYWLVLLGLRNAEKRRQTANLTDSMVRKYHAPVR
jgi:hypothetical protein